MKKNQLRFKFLDLNTFLYFFLFSLTDFFPRDKKHVEEQVLSRDWLVGVLSSLPLGPAS